MPLNGKLGEGQEGNIHIIISLTVSSCCFYQGGSVCDTCIASANSCTHNISILFSNPPFLPASPYHSLPSKWTQVQCRVHSCTTMEGTHQPVPSMCHNHSHLFRKLGIPSMCRNHSHLFRKLGIPSTCHNHSHLFSKIGSRQVCIYYYCLCDSVDNMQICNLHGGQKMLIMLI